jgi:hypothetical protein
MNEPPPTRKKPSTNPGQIPLTPSHLLVASLPI